MAYEKAGGIAEECIKNIKTITSFANYDFEIARFNQRLEESYKAGLTGGFKSGLSLGLFYFLNFSSFALAIFYGSRLIILKEYNSNTNRLFAIGDILTVLISIVLGVLSLGRSGPHLKAIVEAINTAKELFELMERVPRIIKGNEKPNKETLKGKISFKDVTFAYPSKPQTKILNILNLSFEENKINALVGSSGSGKSTIFALIKRIYELNQIENGQITLDSFDISQIDLTYLRSLIGYVPQEPVLLNMSIRDNIIFGRENITDEQVLTACEKAMVDEFVFTKEEGLDYIVGFKGSKLSGGQKQRIAIARAILTMPKILLLDEATSSLDNNSQKEVQNSLHDISKGITVIVIAHRLSTIINSDKIFVLKLGKIVEEGNHSSLMELDNHYATLFKFQISRIGYIYDLSENKKCFKQPLIESEMLKNTAYNSPQKVSPDVSFTRGFLSERKIRNDNFPTFEKVSQKISKEKIFKKAIVQQIDVEKKKKLDIEKLAGKKKYKLFPLLKEQRSVILSTLFWVVIAGSIWPAFGILLADSIDVLSNQNFQAVNSETLMLTMYFLILAFAAGLAEFFQK